MDSMSGGMGVGYACLRLGLIGVLIEKDTTGLYDAAVYRLSLAYRFLSDVGLLCEYGQQPHPPELWEMQGHTWQAQARNLNTVSLLVPTHLCHQACFIMHFKTTQPNTH